MNKDKTLVFDIGMHNGDDTFYYLQKGARVIAVDADPDLCNQVGSRLNSFIEAGDLNILNVAIAEKPGTISLHRSNKSEWNSINKDNSARQDNFRDTISVTATTLQQIIEQFGKPDYCKIDIEGADILALHSLNTSNLPGHISVESESFSNRNLISEEQALAVLTELEKLGYTRFKLVDQYSLQVLNFYKRPFRSLNKWQNFYSRLIKKLVGRTNLDAKNKDKYKYGSSGRMSGELDGDWMNAMQAKKLLLFHRKDFYANPFFKELQFWADWHATY